MTDFNLFKLIEASNADLVTARVPGQYIVQDDGQVFYDNTLGNRVKLSPDLSNFLTKTFAASAVTNVSFAQNATDENTVDISVDSVNPSTGETSTEKYSLKLTDGSITFNDDNNEIVLAVNVTDAATEGDTTAISSNRVALIEKDVKQLIEDAKALAIPTIKTITVAADSTDEAALGTWSSEDVAGKPAKTGDMAILLHAIGETGKISRTAYVYNVDRWEAMDGNYDASNVYLSSDILLAGNYTTVGNVSKGTNAATKDAGWAGMSMADIFTNIFTQTLNPSKPTPSVSMTLNNAGAVEIGTTITPSYTVTYNPKTYSYGSAKDNGKAGGSTYAAPTDVEITTSAGDTLTGTMSVSDTWNGSNVTLTVTDTPFKVAANTSYNASKVTCDYNDGVIPWTNTKKEYAASQVAEGTASSTTATSKITGYYAKYWGYNSDGSIADPANLTTEDIAKLTKVKTIPSSTTNSGMRQIFFIVPKDSVSKVDVIASTTIPFGTAAKGTSVTLTDASGVDTYECDVWYISQPLAGADNETYTISLS